MEGVAGAREADDEQGTATKSEQERRPEWPTPHEGRNIPTPAQGKPKGPPKAKAKVVTTSHTRNRIRRSRRKRTRRCRAQRLAMGR